MAITAKKERGREWNCLLGQTLQFAITGKAKKRTRGHAEKNAPSQPMRLVNSVTTTAINIIIIITTAFITLTSFYY